jgi:capsular polysaccharide biosynthesis protein
VSANPVTSIAADSATTVTTLDCSAAIAEASMYSPEAVVIMGICFILGSLVTTLCLLILDGIRVAIRNDNPPTNE